MRFIIEGEFTTNDLKEFAKVLRKIEQRDTKKTYGMFIDTPDLSMKEASKIVKKIYASTLEKKKKNCKYCGGTGVDPETKEDCPDCKLDKAKKTAEDMLKKLRTPEDVTEEDLEKMLKEIRELRRKLKA